MNVFVLCTGRCGSVTFARASGHATNFSAGHETRSGVVGDGRMAYPPRHIEADNRLSWMLGRLERAYGDDAFYVHLRRDAEATARSLLKRYGRGIIRAYQAAILLDCPDDADPMEVCLDYCHTVNSNIEHFLGNKSRVMTVRLESARDDFQDFWRAIGATGDLSAALGEFDVKHNASKPKWGLWRGLRGSSVSGLAPLFRDPPFRGRAA